MQDLTATLILDIWESVQGLTPAEKAMLILEKSVPMAHDDDERRNGEKRHDSVTRNWSDALSVGRRDALLFELRARIFGSRMEAVLECPSCDRQLELTLNIADLPLQPLGDTGAMTITSDGCTLRFRSPTTKDLLAVRNAATEEEAMRELIQRCVLEGDGREDGEAMSVDVERQVADRIADTDPLTDLTFALQCPLCDHEWNETFDIVSYLWMEIEEVARALLDDVHRLASSYGWSEAQILTLSDSRRSHYLALIDAYAEAKVSVRTRHTGKRGLS